jgi:hypothetical protein
MSENIKRAFKRAVVSLGMYQRAIAVPYDGEDHPNLTDSGTAPRLLELTLVGSENFERKTTKLVLTEQAQYDLILLLQANLGESEELRSLIELVQAEPYSELTL